MSKERLLQFLETGWPAALILMAGMFVLFTIPVKDGDFFWHVRTGQWILEHGELPSEDPFSFASGPNTPRVEFILKQYWLGQVLLYKLWALAGAKAMVAFRAVAYTGILLFMLLWMRRCSRGALPYVFVFLTGVLLREYPNERPQIFSFMFFPVLLFLLERLRQSAGKQPVWLLCLMPSMMLLWGNIHAAYLLGVGVVLIYLVSHIALAVARREKFRPAYSAALCMSAAAPFVNPTGAMSVAAFFGAPSSYISSIYENVTPFTAAMTFKDYYPAYWISVLAVLALLVLNARKMHLAHLISLSALLLFSLTGLRHMYYLLAAFPLLAAYGHRFRKEGLQVLVFTVALMMWLPTARWGEVLNFSFAKEFPVKGTAFIREQQLSGNLFNYYSWGGYLMLESPANKVFIDGRGLREEISNAYDSILWQPQGGAFIDAYGVGIIVMPAMGFGSGEIYPLIGQLIADKRWSLVNMDEVSLVFIRNTPANKRLTNRFAMDKSKVYEHMKMLSDWIIQDGSDRAAHWYSRALAQQELGETAAARESALKALALNPKDIRPRALLTIK